MMSQLFRADMKLVNSLVRLRGIAVPGPRARSESPCPNCGQGSPLPKPLTGNSYCLQRKFFSTRASEYAQLPLAKKSKKKKKKAGKATTEIIEECNAEVAESQARLLKMKPKDLAMYLGSFKSESSRELISTRGFMSYPPQVESHHALNFSSSLHTDLEEGLIDHSLGEAELEKSLSLEEALEETIIIRASTKPSSTCIPGENDLIYSEHDDAVELGSSVVNKIEDNDSFANMLQSEALTAIPSAVKVFPEKVEVPASPETKVKSKKKKKSQNFKQEERELMAKQKREQMEKLAREVSLNKSLVAYLDMCVFTGQLNRGLQSLNHYRHRSKVSPVHPCVTDINAFNVLLHGFAAKANLMKVKEIFRSIREDGLKPSIQTYAAVLECLGRLVPNAHNKQNISTYLDQLTNDGYAIQDLFNKATYSSDQREMVNQAIKRRYPGISVDIQKPNMDYTCNLLKGLNGTSKRSTIVSPAEGLISVQDLKAFANQQLKLELKGTLTVKSVERKEESEDLPYYRKVLQTTEERWGIAVKEALERHFLTLVSQSMKFSKNHRSIGLYPFLKVLSPDDYVTIIIQEIRKLAEGSETFSPSVQQLYRELGAKVLSRYNVLYKKETGILEKVKQMYDEYLDWYLHPTQTNESATQVKNSRQKWQELLCSPERTGPDVDVVEKTWPNSVLSSVGRFLYGVIMRDIKINTQVMKVNSKTEHLVPAFYTIFRMQGVQLKEEIKPHPALVKLFQAASRDELTFDSTLVPMISPPLPWMSIRTGGYLLTPAKIIRLPHQALQQKVRMENCPPEDLYPAVDSLNQLGAVPWRINHKVLDTVIKVFNSKGDDSLGIPPPPSECPLPPTLDVNMTRQEKLKVHKTRLALKRQKAEMYSLWCDALYRLSLANHFRDDIFWFPHNMDFRGRVYPCPPHLNHLGADMARSILVFAQGKPLGPKGLDWLKIHLVNLTGLKKKDSVDDRLKYANELLDDILDSADNPLTGRKWWAESEEPWQSLACCIEIANAIRSGDPESYISHFPVHQDGSCNGLQHYAALGRDQAGAESVNLAPSALPQDVYSLVAALVEKLRDKDAKEGVKVAQVLEGFIKRKVIKQTVMTTVYGVTRYGARLQIAKQLKDLPDFPKEHLWPASLYLVGRTFDSLQEMFTSTKEIQDWFTECARLISQVCCQNVEWVTPLGLPVVQPYFRQSKKVYEAFDPLKLPEVHIFDCFERPNVMKQKNAFPPNFIHSLDSSHMMLTSLFCEQAGITYVSVHDCFWTHPCSVEIMNHVCREQFVALHSEPILEELSRFLVDKYSYKENEFFKDGSITDAAKRRLNVLLTEVPNKGSFNLKSVLKSTYFFS